MKINRLKIENFRIFRGVHEFDLTGKKVILVEGANGHGKSTLFDAISWVITGEFYRFSGSSEQSKFNYLVNNLEYQRKTYRVSVEIDIVDASNNVHTIRREISRLLSGNETKKLFINGTLYTIKDGLRQIISLITKGDFLNQEHKVKSFSSIFSSTQILSQERLEEFVKVDKPTDRYLKLENILGLDKYGKEFKNYINKSKATFEKDLARIDSDLNEANNRLQLLNTKYKDREYIMEYTGEMSESYLIESINNFLYSIPEHLIKYSKVKIESLEDSDINNIRNERKNLENKNIRLQNILSRIHKFNLLDTDIREEEEKIDNYSTELTKKNKVLDRREKAKSKAEKRKQYLSVLRENLDEAKKLKEDINNLYGKSMEIENYFTYVDSNMEIKALIKKYGSHDQFAHAFEDVKVRKEKYINMLELKNSKNELIRVKNKLEKAEEDKRTKHQQLENAIKQKEEKENAVSKLKKLKKNIQEDNFQQITFSIQKSLLNKEKEETECPVCGTGFDGMKTFLSHIENKMKEAQESYDDVEVKLINVQSENSKILSEITRLQGSIELLQDTVKENTEKRDSLKNKIMYLESIASDVSELSLDYIEQKVQELKKFEKEYEQQYKLVINLRKESKRQDSLIKEIKSKEENYNRLMAPFRGKFKSIDDDEHVKSKINKLDSYLDMNNESSKKLKQEILDIELNIEQLNNRVYQINHIMKSMESEIPKSIGYKTNDYLNYLKNQIQIISDIDAELSAKLKNISAFKERDNLTEVKKEIEEVRKIEEGKKQEKSIMEENLQNIERFKDIHTNVQSELINKYLKDNSHIIDQFFRQISPHAYYKHVKLVTRENDLYVLLSEEDDWSKLDSYTKDELKEEVNANLNFSAAQSTILALSIFLALNITQNWSNLNIIGIDDPFQHLDDVNTYSFIDVITSLINNENKQIIVSTHNKNFSDLLMSKLSLMDEDVQKISIVSYSREKIDIKAANYSYSE